jgi:hypothetical protein
MRGLILVAFVALGLAACGKNAQTDNNQTPGENLTAESIVSNDVTAIDAVTGDAANMAADVDLNYGNLEMNGAGPISSEPAKTTSTNAAKPQPSKQNGTAPALNSATNTE